MLLKGCAPLQKFPVDNVDNVASKLNRNDSFSLELKILAINYPKNNRSPFSRKKLLRKTWSYVRRRVSYGLVSVVVGPSLNKCPGEMIAARHPPPGSLPCCSIPFSAAPGEMALAVSESTIPGANCDAPFGVNS